MVGYVDDAIVGSQVRIRFDAGFHDNAPDRAEFFYAQYAGLNGPGPNSVVADLNFQQLYMRAELAHTITAWSLPCSTTRGFRISWRWKRKLGTLIRSEDLLAGIPVKVRTLPDPALKDSQAMSFFTAWAQAT